jgi:hypothetical protein
VDLVQWVFRPHFAADRPKDLEAGLFPHLVLGGRGFGKAEAHLARAHDRPGDRRVRIEGQRDQSAAFNSGQEDSVLPKHR